MSEAITQAAAYDLIDRFLRNNLYDDDYAEYSKALEAISQPAPAPQPAAPVVSDEQIKETIDCIDWSQMVTADDYMYMIARAILALRPAVEPVTPFTPSQRMRLWQNTEKGKSATSLGAFERICQAVEAAHRIGQESPQPAAPVVSDEQIITIRKASKAADPTKPWSETLAFARAILAMRPAVEPMTPEQRKIDQAVHEAVSAIYFADGADYLRALWSVVRGLSPDLARVLELDGEIAWNISEQITTAIGITAKPKGVRDGDVS